jgi:hypothetical protein
MTQTAVQWLVEQILPNRIDLKTNNVKQTSVDFLIEKLIPQTITQEQFYIIEQAVEMEKQQKGYSEEEVLEFWNWLNDGFIIRKSLPTREELIGWFKLLKNK